MAIAATAGQHKARILELHAVLLHGRQGPSTKAMFGCFPKAFSRELDDKWSSQGMKQPVWDASAYKRGDLAN